MARGRPRERRAEDTGDASVQAATTRYDAELWSMADALRGSMDVRFYFTVSINAMSRRSISLTS